MIIDNDYYLFRDQAATDGEDDEDDKPKQLQLSTKPGNRKNTHKLFEKQEYVNGWMIKIIACVLIKIHKFWCWLCG